MLGDQSGLAPELPSARQRVDSWELTGLISPRSRVRLSVRDSSGVILNEYTRTIATSSPAPTVPWAIHLADVTGRFKLLCFDLDASKGQPALDAGKLTLWLRDLGIPYLVAQSGPSGGRHVWIALDDSAPAQTVDAIARLAKYELPSLDLSPLTNPITGAVRPPGAPHRNGGHSEILEGVVETLTFPTTDHSDLDRMLRYLIELTGGFRKPSAAVRPENVRIDAHGHPFLERGRALSPASRKLVHEGRPSEDASALMASALARCAHAGMTLAQVLAIAPTSPAFVHAYSSRTGTATRTPRHPARARAIIERMWSSVVDWVATSEKAFTGDDPTFDERAGQVLQLVQAVQTRADASPGRWARSGAGPAQTAGTGRYSDRLILDALSLLTLQAVSASVEASDRTLAQLAGVGRETARTALLRLQDDGWIEQASPADGPNAAKWGLRQLSTGSGDWNRSQVPPPPGLPASLRIATISTLQKSLSATRHDVFAAPHSLGRSAGRIYARLEAQELLDVAEISHRAGVSVRTARRHLLRLERHELAWRAGPYWQLPDFDHRGRAADTLGVAGYLVDREQRYSVERQAWAWWRAELERRHSPGRARRRRRQADQAVIIAIDGSPDDYPIHPKHKDGRADFAAARRAIANGILLEPSTVTFREAA